MSLLKVNTIQHGSISSGGIELAADGSVKVGGIQAPSGGGYGRRNLLINGDFRIDQRVPENATSQSGYVYGADQWFLKLESTSPILKSYRDVSYDGIVVAAQTNSSDNISQTSGQVNVFGTAVEGSHFGGLSLNEPTVLSFKFSQAGLTLTNGASYNLGGAVVHYSTQGNVTWSFPFQFTFTYDSVNPNEVHTFEVAVPGKLIEGDDYARLGVLFNLGSSTDMEVSPTGSWVQAEVVGATSAALRPYVYSQNNNVLWNFSDVQLEKGVKATTFEYVPYEQTLRECQRYFQTIVSPIYTSNEVFASGKTIAGAQGSSYIHCMFRLPVRMYDRPSLYVSGENPQANGDIVMIEDPSSNMVFNVEKYAVNKWLIRSPSYDSFVLSLNYTSTPTTNTIYYLFNTSTTLRLGAEAPLL